MMRLRAMLLMVCLCLSAAGAEGAAPSFIAPLALIPRPLYLRQDAGSFALTAATPVLADASSMPAARCLAVALAGALGSRPALLEMAAGRPGPAIRLQLRDSRAELGPEGYTLRITPRQVLLQAAAPAGLSYGVQTLCQLLPLKAQAAVSLPCLRITDRPRFAWRGYMLDCSRTSWRPAYLKRTLDRMALYKLNVLHLHLTDDQGWRVEIHGHPRLTGVGARFAPRFKEAPEREGFYSQAEVRELVRYAADRYVTIVPEIEMPGHCNALLAAYPELSCTGGPFEVYPYHTGPGVQADVLCPGNERTFQVLEEVLTQVIALFPSPYIHIGGDECPKERWGACRKCQARIRQEGLKDEAELQSYFVRRIARFIESKGRRLIGWDEILEGGLAANATVMAWRGTGGGIQAARLGHEVVMSPTSHCYFDYLYSAIPTAKVYAYEPVPSELTPEQGRRVLGAQANMWTHIARTERDVDIQVYPRLLALSEVVWSPREPRSWPEFRARLQQHLPRLAALGAAYQADEWDWWPDARASLVLPARLTSSSGTWDQYGVDYAFDGRLDSFYWNDRPIRAGDTVTLALEQPLAVEQVEVYTGRPDLLIARMHYGVLEVSEDGQVFRAVGPIGDDGVARARLDGQSIKAVRIRALGDQGPCWLMVREFVLRATHRP